MLQSHVTIQVTLLSKSALTNGTNELRFHAAFVLLVPPQRCEEHINAIALGAYVILPRFLPVVVALLTLSLVRLPALVTLKRFVPQQWRFQGECSATVAAEILTGARSAGLVTISSRHRAKTPTVHGDARRRRQGGYRPIGRTVRHICKSKKRRERWSSVPTVLTQDLNSHKRCQILINASKAIDDIGWYQMYNKELQL